MTLLAHILTANAPARSKFAWLRRECGRAATSGDLLHAVSCWQAMGYCHESAIPEGAITRLRQSVRKLQETIARSNNNNKTRTTNDNSNRH